MSAWGGGETRKHRLVGVGGQAVGVLGILPLCYMRPCAHYVYSSETFLERTDRSATHSPPGPPGPAQFRVCDTLALVPTQRWTGRFVSCNTLSPGPATEFSLRGASGLSALSRGGKAISLRGAQPGERVLSAPACGDHTPRQAVLELITFVGLRFAFILM